MNTEQARQMTVDAKERLTEAVEDYFAAVRELEVAEHISGEHEHDCDDPHCMVTRTDAVHSIGTWIILVERNAIAGDDQASRMMFAAKGSPMAMIGLATDFIADLTVR